MTGDATILKHMDLVLSRFSRIQEMQPLDELNAGKKCVEGILSPRSQGGDA
jgi:hypothetical protein